MELVVIKLGGIKLSDFETWYLEVMGIAQEKMSINLGVSSADAFSWSYAEGLTPINAVKRHYGLT